MAEIRPLAEVVRETIVNACIQTRNPMTAAKLLHIGRTTIYRKLRDFGLKTSGFAEGVAVPERPAPPPPPPPPPVPISRKLLLLPSTKAEEAQAHLKCPRCGAMLLEEERTG